MGVELEQQMSERDHRRAEGETLLRNLLKGAIGFGTAHAVLEQRGLGGTLVSLAVAPSGAAAWGPREIHHAPELHRVSPLLLQEERTMIAILPDREDLILPIAKSLGTESRAGVSGPITAAGFVESIGQARLALAQAHETRV